MRALVAALALAPALAPVLAAGACSSPQDAGTPPATPDERRALAEAETMIPAGERSPASATPAPTESPAP